MVRYSCLVRVTTLLKSILYKQISVKGEAILYIIFFSKCVFLNTVDKIYDE